MARASHPGLYDEMGLGYCRRRRGDPRIAAQIDAARGDASRVVNIGAGAGSCEPRGREVVALEPSLTMIAQHPPGLLIRGVAERLPFRDGAFDAVLAVLTVHHWRDARKGLAELRQLADDLQSGAWEERNAELLERDAMDWGYRLVVSAE